MASEHEHEHEFYYYLAVNEDGWRCASCDHKPGEPAGFMPDLDRSEIATKVMCILQDIHAAGLVYLSNSSAGESVEIAVTNRCQKRGLYDQYSIARFILDALQPPHAAYWKKVSRGVLIGHDIRDRCPCGALATSYSSAGGTGEWMRRCSAHHGLPTSEVTANESASR